MYERTVEQFCEYDAGRFMKKNIYLAISQNILEAFMKLKIKKIPSKTDSPWDEKREKLDHQSKKKCTNLL